MKDGFYTTKEIHGRFAKIKSGKGLYFHMYGITYTPYSEVIWGPENNHYVNQKIGPLQLLEWNK